MKTENTPHSIAKIDALIIVALCAIAIAQPLYNILGNAATFFVAHNAGRFQILFFVFLISVAIPAVLIIVEFISGLISSKIRRYVHHTFVAILAGGFFLVILNKLPSLPPVINIAASVSLGVAFAALLARLPGLRSVTALMSFSAIVFPALFLFFTPVSSLVFGKASAEFKTVDIESDTPVVLVIFDEFTPLSLLDSQGEIDPVRFPNFAEFAKTGTWYPNAAAVHYRTRIVIPAILTGNLPPDDVREIPTQTTYPNNLFTLLGDSYNLNAVERVSTLCPKVFCASEGDTRKFNFDTFWSDISIIFKHIYYPKLWAQEHLPELNENWNNFANETSRNIPKNANDTSKTADQIALEKIVIDRRKLSRKDIYENFLADINGKKRTLDFIHIVIPHFAWEYLPDGRKYENRSTNHERMWHTQELADEVYHRYLMQVGYVDKMVGDLMTRLKEVDKYDEALIILVADHGITFKKGLSSRDISKDPSVLHVPLFVKYPEQKEGRVDETQVLNIDILPTIADVLDIELPWSADGQSLLDEKPRETARVKMKWHGGQEYEYTHDQIIDEHAIPDRIEKFGERTPLNRLSIQGRFNSLIGKPLSDLGSLVADSSTAPKIKYLAKEFENVSLDSDYLPAMFYGEIDLGEDTAVSYSIAVALNGKVSAVVPTTGSGKTREFAVLLPPADFITGHNEIETFLVFKSAGGSSAIIPIEMDAVNARRSLSVSQNVAANKLGSGSIIYKDGQFELSRSGSDVKSEDIPGTRYSIEKINKPGYFTSHDRGSLMSFTGWAAYIDGGKPADKVVMFRGGHYVGTTTTGDPSPGLVEMFKKPSLSHSRYSLTLEKSELEKYTGDTRFFGVYDDGFAAELDYRPK